MTIAKLSFSQNILHPWSFKTIDGEKKGLSRIEKIKSIAMLIIGLPLAIVGGPLLFYTYTNVCKKRQIKKLEHLQGDFASIGNWFADMAEQIKDRNIEKAAKYLPKNAKILRTLYPMSKKIKSLLDRCKKSTTESELRCLLLDLGETLKKLNKQNKLIHDEHLNFMRKPECDTAAREKMESAQEELDTYKKLEDKAYKDMARLVDSLPVHPGDLDQEIKLLDGIPTDLQYERFRKVLMTQFVIHNVTGDGACAPRSLSNGIWLKLLKYRLENEDATHPEEHALALQLRNEVVDYMIENVNNFKNRKNVKNNTPHNDDGTEAHDYRSFSIREDDGTIADLDAHFEAYAQNMRQERVWFGDPEMKAAAQKYGVRDGVHIMTFSPGSIEVKNNRLYPLEEYNFGNRKGRRIYLFHSGGHYEIMSPRVGYTERMAPKTTPMRQR